MAVGAAVGVAIGSLFGAHLLVVARRIGISPGLLVLGAYGLFVLIGTLRMVFRPRSGKVKAGKELARLARRHASGTSLVDDRDRVSLEIEHRRGPLGGCTLVNVMAEQDFEDAFVELDAGQPVTTLASTSYVVHRFGMVYQLPETTTIANVGYQGAKKPAPARFRALRRLRNNWSEQTFLARSGQIVVTEAELRMVAGQLGRARAAR